jgi:pimeloyl-ACP methyl ester carboxylesterase
MLVLYAMATLAMRQEALRVHAFSPTTRLLTRTLCARRTAFLEKGQLTRMAIATQSVELQTTEFSSTETTATTTTTRPPVLLLHGLLGSKRNFSSIATSLHAQLEIKRRIMAVDLRNHGENTPLDWRSDMSYVSMAQDVLHVMDKHQLDRAVLVGHSMGGKVAQAMALLFPERVDGLVVLDIAPVTYSNDEPHWKAVTDIVSALVNVPVGILSKRDVDEQLRETVPDPALRAFLLTNWNNDNKTWNIPMHHIQSQMELLAGFTIDMKMPSSSSSLSPNINNNQVYMGDVFFIHGGQSRFVRHSHMETIASYFPNHMLTTVRGAGHWVHAEAPDATVALLKRYLDR